MLDIIIMVVSIIAVICIWIMLYDTNSFEVSEVSFRDKRIKKCTRAVMLSDLHNKRYGKNNERLLAAIRAAAPDFILVGGDLITARPGAGLEVGIHLLEELAKEFPIYYANGNHEHRLKLYPETYGDMAEKYNEALHRIGVKLLVNEKMELPEFGITIYGSEIDRFYYKRFKVQTMGADYLNSILGQPNPGTYNILLAHNPDYFPQYAAWGADLTLSGHVHGGMVRIPFLKKGVVSPNVRFFPKYDGGIFKEDKSIMLLSRGLGVHTIPIRLFNPAELNVIKFEPEE